MINEYAIDIHVYNDGIFPLGYFIGPILSIRV